MMMSNVNRYWWLYLLRGLLALLFGVSVIITAVLFPGATIRALVILFGAYLVATGMVTLTSAIIYRPESLWGSLVLNGLLNVALGVLAFVWTELTAVALMVMFALWMLAIGLLDILFAIRMRRVVERQWTMAFSGVIAIVVGTLILIFPAIGLLGIMWLIGGFAAASGLFSMSCGWRMRRFRQQGATAQESAERTIPNQAESEPV